ncbi:hypothetical protein [Leptospira congkakensis]|uniref:hypothetical protein n=1 Tax=Leptospira congkakensis TaxID=2484932 RepID=UPI001FCC65BF|nr:hypothetical protein [Leptospira congkakensis]
MKTLVRKILFIVFAQTYIVGILILFLGCASLLPPERRVYPNNPVLLPKDIDIHQWMETKLKQHPKRLGSRQMNQGEYKFTYFRKEFTSLGSYRACTGLIRSVNPEQIELYNLISMINHGNYTTNKRSKGGDLGPMNEKERTEILLPCIEEFLEPPGSKE